MRAPFLTVAPAPDAGPAPEAEPLPRPARARRPARSRRSVAAWRGRPGRAAVPVLGLAITLEPGQAGQLTGAVLARVLRSERRAGTVALDLGQATEIDADSCQALAVLFSRLESVGIALRLVAASAPLRAQLQDVGRAHQPGIGAVHPTLRSAILAAYAEVPGPGLVTGQVLDALTVPAEPVVPLPEIAVLPASPAEDGARLRP